MRAWTKKVLAAGTGDGCDEILHEFVSLDRIDAETMLDRHRYRHRIPHRLDAIGDQLRLGHQAGAKGAVLHAFGRAAAVQVDFVVTILFPEARAVREFDGIGTAELQCNRMLGGIEAQVPVDVAMDQRAGRDHFGVDHGVPGKLPEEITAMAVRPVHHRRRAQTMVELSHADVSWNGVGRAAGQRSWYSSLMP